MLAALNKAASLEVGDNTSEMEKEAADKVLAITDILSVSANIKAMHVKTGRYSQHMALDQAFDDLNSALDGFCECVQGHYIYTNGGSGLKLDNSEVTFKLPSDDGVPKACRELFDKFKLASDYLVKGVSPLVSVQDDVLNCFYRLFYRLNLK